MPDDLMSGPFRTACRHEIHNLDNAVIREKAGDQYIGIWPIQLFFSDPFTERLNLEISAFFVVQNPGKNARRIEPWTAIPVDGTASGNQRRCTEVSDDSVILNWVISYVRLNLLSS